MRDASIRMSRMEVADLDPRGLPLKSKWFEDGPFIQVDFCESRATGALHCFCANPPALLAACGLQWTPTIQPRR